MERSALHKTSQPANQSAGNFFGRKKEPSFFSPSFIQPKLTIGPADDPYEREADAVADRVMRMSDTETLQTKISPVNVQRKCSHCEEEEKIQTKPGPGLIQRQSADEEEEAPPTPVPDPDNDWSRNLNLRLPTWDQMDHGGLNTALHVRGVPRPESYADEAAIEFHRQLAFNRRFGLGKVVRNLDKIPVLKIVIPGTKGDDPEVGLANLTVPVAVGAALRRDYPSLQEKNDTGPVIPIYSWEF